MRLSSSCAACFGWGSMRYPESSVLIGDFLVLHSVAARRREYNRAYAHPLSRHIVAILAQGAPRAGREGARIHAEIRENLGAAAGIPGAQPGRRGAGADRTQRDG